SFDPQIDIFVILFVGMNSTFGGPSAIMGEGYRGNAARLVIEYFHHDWKTRDERGAPLASRRRPSDSLADLTGPGRGRHGDGRACPQPGVPRRLGRAPARPTRRRGHLGRRPVVRRRALFPQVDFDDLHHAVTA